MRHLRIAGQNVDDRFLLGSINEAALAAAASARPPEM
jgi:hypothetical protein